MHRARQPSKQLNSDAIRGAVLGYISPVVSGKCSIISAKCVWNVKEKDLSKSWRSICNKRDSCDEAIAGWFVNILPQITIFPVFEMRFVFSSDRYTQCSFLFQCCLHAREER